MKQVQLTSAGLPGARPLPGPLLLSVGCPLCLAHSSCFPFISGFHCLQRAWEFSSEAMISILHSWQFSIRESSSCSSHLPAAELLLDMSRAARACDTTCPEFLPQAVGAATNCTLYSGPWKFPLPFLPTLPEMKHHLNRFLYVSVPPFYHFPK